MPTIKPQFITIHKPKAIHQVKPSMTIYCIEFYTHWTLLHKKKKKNPTTKPPITKTHKDRKIPKQKKTTSYSFGSKATPPPMKMTTDAMWSPSSSSPAQSLASDYDHSQSQLLHGDELLLLPGNSGDDSAHWSADGGCQSVSNNISYMNVSCISDLDISVTLFGYCSPFLVLTTVISNTLIVMVLSRRNMQTPTNTVLMGECGRKSVQADLRGSANGKPPNRKYWLKSVAPSDAQLPHHNTTVLQN